MQKSNNPLSSLNKLGQSFWIDYIDRALLETGQLNNMIEQDGLSGLTSNPSIFEKVISTTNNYDIDLKKAAAKNPSGSPQEWFEEVAIREIQQAADTLKNVYETTNMRDGYVSLEVSPLIARDTKTTIEEARRLWSRVGRNNLMIKVPATEEGFPAIEQLISESINVNVTLIFSLEQYKKTALSYIKGLSKVSAPNQVASVASFFVSRVDTKVDALLEKVNKNTSKQLEGKTAIANARNAYKLFYDFFESPDFLKLKQKGAQAQRLLWGSTSTKNPNYPDTLYIDQLIGTSTVNTIPPATVDAFRDHGKAKITLDKNSSANDNTISDLTALGINLEQVCAELLEEGLTAFSDSYIGLLEAVSTKGSE